jgi:cytochrome c1
MAATPDRPRPSARWRALLVVLAVSAGAAVAGACGGDSAPALTGEAARGKEVAKAKGCASCHTATGGRSEGPTWKGLAGSSVNLADGTTVVADDAYLTRAIKDPRAQIVQGFRTPMPAPAGLTDTDLAALLAYIKALK